MNTPWNLKVIKAIFRYALGLLIIVGTYALLLYLTKYVVPSDNTRLLDMGFGVILGSFTTVVSYFFGSSQGSSDKQDQINKTMEIKTNEKTDK